MTNEIVSKTELGLLSELNTVYKNQIINFFSDEDKAMKFLSCVRADFQRNPKLLECTKSSIFNAYITMAQFGFMPSSVSGEAYVIPYNKNIKVGNAWETITEAQFQLGYKGLVTLLYKAGIQKIVGSVIRKNDKYSLIDGVLTHEVNLLLSNEERGDVIGAYTRITYNNEETVKFMNIKDLLAHAEKFSKSYDPVGKYSPHNPENDPERWMLVKTVLKQHCKLLPQNETIARAIEEDNKDSRISDVKKMQEKNALSMGKMLETSNKINNETQYENENNNKEEVIQIDEMETSESKKK